MPDQLDDAALRDLLHATRTVAVLGASLDPARPSHGVTGALVRAGYRVYPINPAWAGRTMFGRTILSDLSGIGRIPDLVDIFRRSEEAGALVDAAVALGVKAIWLQLGVHAPAAVARARSAGCTVIEDRCIAIEHARLIDPSA